METDFERLPEATLAQLSSIVAARFGLAFPPDRWVDLERAFRAAALERSGGIAAYIARLVGNLATQSELQALATHLTIGETYFFRDPAIFNALEQTVLPTLIAERRPANRHLRIWSAGCATGEEPYSLAILLTRLIRDWREWQIHLYASDLDERALEAAKAGVYGEWSFRATPNWTRNEYFRPTADGKWVISPELSKLVRFSQMNLLECSPPNWAHSMDLIVCRNVLMYLTAEANRTAVATFQRCLSSAGWLVVSPAEVSPTLFADYTRTVHGGAILYRKGSEPVVRATPDAGIAYYKPAVNAESEASGTVALTPDPIHEARELANQGNLQEARAACERVIDNGHATAAVHYLRAVILDEQGLLQEAAGALRTAVYLDPEFVIAHFALGNLALKRGARDEYLRHYENSLGVLFNYQRDDILPESGGLTAGRLREMISTRTNGTLATSAGSVMRRKP